ncbi:5'-methylthioadenosine/S-adenosylhomocysteine nucleosidase [Desulfurivibrio dismutans]|uniref:5'-methylthioadenosine/S-adenosylhomocysteine nucleosidase n=1 Tax=Desulfurivibrio dismutans TaxID=1398908 RepID=UPI0023DB9601|nr:5'-methylthioadenosine/S-adenosylhomocysteine nucleosidase [Desulfurivibrio alkaliphilus]MDF1613789.1 5'-methylthioadenosine/S-adenosylhomocysteine nucleosidase [Desulfurivibrio alkaliphilus]
MVETNTTKFSRFLLWQILFGAVLLFLLPPASWGATGIIVARTDAFESIRSLMSNTSTLTRAGREYVTGRHAGRDLVLVRSPMGKVNNTITTQILLSEFEVDLVISIAPAGAVDQNLKIGDMVLADRVYQHDFGTIKPYGFIWGRTPDGTGWEDEGYNAHPETAAMEQAWRRSKPAGQKGWKLVIGPVVSGDQMIADEEKRDWLRSKFQAVAVDMSGAAIIQTCFANGVRGQIVRIITDQADIAARSDFEASFGPDNYEPDYRLLIKILLDAAP